MRTIAYSIIAAGMIYAPGAAGQIASESGVDFLGIYAPPIYDGGGPPRRQPDEFPYTTAGRQAYESYDSERDNPRVRDNCAPDTMPRIIFSGNPMEMYEEDGRLVIRYERGNVVRTVHMDESAPPADEPFSYVGFSAGWWEGDVLTIQTTHMSGTVVQGGSTPMSREARVIERYWREPGELDLQHELEVHDPVNYTEPFVMGREWIWDPNEEIREWNCVDFGANDEPPDIDEVLRMLEEL